MKSRKVNRALGSLKKTRGKRETIIKKKKVQKMSRFKGFDQDWLLRKGNDLNPTDRYFFS